MSVIYCTVDGNEVNTQSGSLSIYDRATSNANTASFQLVNPDNEPLEGNAVQIYLDGTSQMLFGGVIATITREYVAPQTVSYICSCVGYWRLFDRRLVVEHYESDLMTFSTTSVPVISHIIDNYTDPALGFTMTNVVYDSPQFDLLFNYRKPSDCLRELAEVESAQWYIDSDKDVHFYIESQADSAPLEINDANLQLYFETLRINSDYTQIRNRVFVQGGYIESIPKTVTYQGNGVQKYWMLPYRPHDISLEVDGTPKTLGKENVDVDDGTYEYMYNYYEQTLYCGLNESAPAEGKDITITMNFEYPALTRVDNQQSQSDLAIAEGGDGIYEYVVKDNTLTSKTMCKHRGNRELKNWAFPKVDGSVSIVGYYGFKAGQKIVLNITNPDGTDYRYNDTYFIKQIFIEDLGNNILRYNINFEGNYGN